MRCWMLVIVLAVGSAVVFLGSGCGGGTQEDTITPTATYLPLAVGNEWHYAVTDYTTASAHRGRSLRLALAGRPGLHTAQTTAEETVTITGTTPIGGHTWYRATLGWVGDPNTEDRYLRHDRAGLLWKELITSVGYYRLKAPIAVGTKWVDPTDSRYSYAITSVSDSVSVPAGDFTSCVCVVETFRESGSPDETVTVWFAEGVGMVQEVQYVGANVVYESALQSYRLTP